ncbi:hypothetical protein [Sneathiella sp. HT1-7]|uniref:hypothetical protein n=1 Tax=Sneathiella sp. HT1-7 TaxID=2887192 RepID=UPI001D14781A|nr:hypothetical protein [Sneathiella sp. HT1-7]MCC3304563.1 hypothetical protein [Sneathiella sp. HT1-7]
MAGSSIAVVHLVRKSNGMTPFRNFLSSYKAHHEPLCHDLVLIFKDFEEKEKAPYMELLADTAFVAHDFPGDGGLDLGPYFDVSQKLDYEYFCFLNSFSEIQSDNWLTHLYNCFINNQDAGIVGATGSWESTGADDPPFPNPHIRTNGFIIAADIMRHLEFFEIKTKDDARHMESGHKGITRQVQKMGKLPYIVDRNGTCWPVENWPESATFRSGNQRALLISDNRTRAFDEGDDWAQEYLFDLAWTGKPSKANPFKRHKMRHRLRRFLEKRRSKTGNS